MRKRVKVRKRGRLVAHKNTAKLTVNIFELHGQTTHSKNALTLQFVIDHCEKNSIPYCLTAWPGQGYIIKKITPDSFKEST